MSNGNPAGGEEAAALTQAFGKLQEVIGPVVQAMQGMAGIVQAVASKIAESIQQVIQSFQQIVSATRPFVEAFAPSTIMIFDQAMRDLTAVIGRALLPIMQSAGVIVREFADTLAPISKELQPVFATLGQALRTIYGAFIEVAGKVLTSLTPAFAMLADVGLMLAEIVAPLVSALGSLLGVVGSVVSAILALLRPAILVLGIILKAIAAQFEYSFAALAAVVNAVLAPIQAMQAAIDKAMQSFRKIIAPLDQIGKAMQDVFEVFVGGLQGLWESLASFFSGLFGGSAQDGLQKAIKAIVDTFGYLVKTLTVVAGTIAKLFGMSGALDGMIKALEKKTEDSTGTAAVNAAFKSIESFGRDLAIAAATASGTAGETKTDNQLLKEMLAALKEVKESDANLPKLIAEALSPLFKEGVREIIGAIGQPGYAGEGLATGLDAAMPGVGSGIKYWMK